MTLSSNICRLFLTLSCLWPLVAGCEQLHSESLDFSAQRRLAQEKYEASVRLCYQKFAVSDCKQEAVTKLNAALAPLKKSEDEKLLAVRAQNAVEKVQSLTSKMPALPREDTRWETSKTVSEIKTPPKVSKGPAETDLAPVRPTAQEEQAQRKKFEDKQLRAQQHRDALEKRWADKKGANAAPASPMP